MTVHDIILQVLRDGNYDGLCTPDAGCGCDINDLAPCDGVQLTCEPARKHTCCVCRVEFYARPREDCAPPGCTECDGVADDWRYGDE